jgi:AcrR family transcriptional regulator
MPEERGAADAITRRPAFPSSPIVGPRGQRTRQKLLDAAREAFAEDGVYDTGIESIVRRAGVSRVAFYQYFSGKPEIFQAVAREVLDELCATTESLAPATADGDGRARMHAWVCGLREVYVEGVGVFRAAYTASAPKQLTSELQAESLAAMVRSTRTFFSQADWRPVGTDVVTILIDTVIRTLRYSHLLQGAAAEAYPNARIDDALTDALHRSLFGRVPGVNDEGRPPATSDPVLRQRDQSRRASASHIIGSTTYEALIEAGAKVIGENGLHAAKVDDIVAIAGVSHSNFYYYFKNLTELAEVLLRRALRPVSLAMETMPVDGGTELREWLASFSAEHSRQTPVIRVWGEVALRVPELESDGAVWVDWLRRELEKFLQPRGFGDASAEGVVLFALLDSVGALERSSHTVERVTDLVEVGFLGRPR